MSNIKQHLITTENAVITFSGGRKAN